MSYTYYVTVLWIFSLIPLFLQNYVRHYLSYKQNTYIVKQIYIIVRCGSQAGVKECMTITTIHSLVKHHQRNYILVGWGVIVEKHSFHIPSPRVSYVAVMYLLHQHNDNLYTM